MMSQAEVNGDLWYDETACTYMKNGEGRNQGKAEPFSK